MSSPIFSFHLRLTPPPLPLLDPLHNSITEVVKKKKKKKWMGVCYRIKISQKKKKIGNGGE